MEGFSYIDFMNPDQLSYIFEGPSSIQNSREIRNAFRQGDLNLNPFICLDNGRMWTGESEFSSTDWDDNAKIMTATLDLDKSYGDSYKGATQIKF